MLAGLVLTLCSAITIAPRPVFAEAPNTAHTLTVASFNILKGDTSAKTLEVIRASGADVVGIQEADGGAPALAAALGWHVREFSFDRGTERGNSDCAIVSRFPITQTLRHGVRVQVAPGREAYVFNAHLRAYPYQPYNLRDGELRGEAEVIRAATAARGAEIDEILDEMSPYVAAGRAVFLTGDFNEPSHVDWTSAAASAGLHPLPVAWPTSTKIVAAGLSDSLRQLRPDPVKHPAYTWTPRPEAHEVHDRIDFVYLAGIGVRATDVRIVGETRANADVVVEGYPSDHRAVSTTFTASAQSLAPLRIGVNLISNGGAEGNPGAAVGADRDLTDWEAAPNYTPATAQLYGKPDYAVTFPGSGANYFYGGDAAATGAASHAIRQTVDVGPPAAQIDRGQIDFDLSGHFGGYARQSDSASLSAEFLDAEGAVIALAKIGDVTPAERQYQNALVRRQTSGAVPPGSRTIRLTLTFSKGAKGTFSDGSADNLSLVLSER
jgi:endonuclease/exonuclease/phosphatase family metal-dependent hydrolase